jgi:ABC transporter, substrate-binding protein, aliphatic sulfonates family
MTRKPRATAPRVIRILAVAAMCAGLAGTVAGCSSSADAAAAGKPATQLRLGYFDNVTHAPALIGVHEGIFAKDLGKTALKTEQFNAGPAEIEALSAGAIDAAFVGPSPAINSFAASGGQSLRVIAGATNGGAALVVRNGIQSVSDLKGKTLATPQLGNTQDVALRTYLAKNGLKAPITGGGDVTITPTDNAQTLQLFKQGKLDGAWLPEPWVSRLVIEGGAHVLVDEKTQWKNGAFPTTVLVVSTDFLKKHPATVARLVNGERDAVAWLKSQATPAAVAAINAQLKADSGKALSDAVVARALGEVSFSVDPLASTFPIQLRHAVDAGLSKNAKLTGLFDLRQLNADLADSGTAKISVAGLGEQ